MIPRGGDGPRGPVILLGYARSGAEELQRLLAGQTSLACTSGTGVLPTCAQAAATWRQVDNRAGRLSSLAKASIRALASCIITTITAGSGESCWCEVSYAPAMCAETFLELFPGTKFVCVHRDCTEVIAAGVAAHPWGLSESPFRQYAAVHPGNGVAAIADYWAYFTEALLQFEQAHSDACCRVRYEDLRGAAGQLTDELVAFLDLGPPDQSRSRRTPDELPASAGQPAQPGNGAHIPVDRIPPHLWSRVNKLLSQVGYPPMPRL